MSERAAPASGPQVDGADEAQEAALLQGLRAGDDDAFERFVREHGGRAFTVAVRLLSNDEDARDAVQDAFLAAFRALDSFRGDSRLATWLHRIVVNAALQRLRRRRRKPEIPIEDLLPHFREDGHPEDPAVPWQEPADAAVERAEDRRRVRESIDRLPDTYRTVLLLRDIEELDTEATASLLEITPNAVKVRLHRARQALRTLLDRQFRGIAP